jgi:hypothetical protein
MMMRVRKGEGGEKEPTLPIQPISLMPLKIIRIKLFHNSIRPCLRETYLLHTSPISKPYGFRRLRTDHRLIIQRKPIHFPLSLRSRLGVLERHECLAPHSNIAVSYDVQDGSVIGEEVCEGFFHYWWRKKWVNSLLISERERGLRERKRDRKVGR